MTKQVFFSSILMLTILNIKAQQKFEIGIEGGVSQYFYSIVETQNNLKNTPNISGFGGVNFRLNSNKKFFGEVGFILTEYTEGIKLRQELGYITSNHDGVLIIPFRFGRPFLIAKCLSFVPSVGMALAIKTSSQDGSSSSYRESVGNTSLMYDYTFRRNGKDLFFLMNGNAMFEWEFKNKMKVLAGVNYYQGFTKVSVADISYKINNEPMQAGLLIGKGTFIGYSIGLKYSIK